MNTRMMLLGSLATTSLLLTMLAVTPAAYAADPASGFTKPTVDIGIVARDAEKSARFYGETIGLKELKGFSATAEFGKQIGLVDGHPINVRVFVAEEVEGATRIKLMSFPAANGKLPDLLCQRHGSGVGTAQAGRC